MLEDKKDYQPIEPKYEIPRYVKIIVLVVYWLTVFFCFVTGMLGFAVQQERIYVLLPFAMAFLVIIGMGLTEKIFFS